MTEKKIDIDKIYAQAAARCAAREYAEGDMRQFFLRKGITPDEAAALVERLKAAAFIDNARFARAYTHDKVAYDAWGKQKIKYMLRQKSVEDALIEAAIDEIDDTLYMDNLRRVVAQKKRSVKARNDYERRQKVAKYAATRGYELSLIFDLLGDDDDEIDSSSI